MRLATAPLFGGGVLVVIPEPAALARSKSQREGLLGLLEAVAPGNGLAFAEVLAPGARATAASLRRVLCSAIEERGGRVRECPAPRSGQMGMWIAARAVERGLQLDPAAQRLLAERVGGAVREGDIDRRRQTELADAELTKLALYRPDQRIRAEDVDALVTPTIPASAWAFLDAVGARQAGLASDLAERLLAEGVALPVIVTQLHRRLRQLIELRELATSGATPREIVTETRLHPYRADILGRQAAAWSSAELASAIDGLFAVDLASKGLAAGIRRGGAPPSRGPLSLTAWIADCVVRRG